MTEPLTPPECDLRDYPWMPVDCTRLLTSETWLLGTSDQKVAAFTLWAKSWHQVPAGSLPDNDRMLGILSEAGVAWKRVREHALRGWVKCSDGRLYHPVVCEKANEAHKLKLAQKARTEAARAAKAARQNAATEPPQTPVATPVTEPVTDTVTGSTRPDQTRPDLKEREERETSVPVPEPADVERAETAAAPQWPPPPLPSAIAATVGVLTAKLEGRHRDTKPPGPVAPRRTADEQLAALGKPKVRAHYASEEALKRARAELALKRARAEGNA